MLPQNLTCRNLKELEGDASGAETDTTALPNPAFTAEAVIAGVEASLEAARIPPCATLI